MVIELVVFFVPVALSLLFTNIFDEAIGYYILIAIGLAFTLTHNIWLRNIYQRFMERRYENLEGFRATR